MGRVYKVKDKLFLLLSKRRRPGGLGRSSPQLSPVLRRLNDAVHRGTLIGIIVFLLTLGLSPERIYAQEPWPPFRFDLTPLYENGKITYHIVLRSQVDGQISDLLIKIPLPEGTRYLKSSAPAAVNMEFDGREVTVFTAALDEELEETSFTVEVTDPTMTVFTTQAWLTWKGEHQGDYLAEAVSIDITRQPLNWTRPPRSRLQLGLRAIVADDVITYTLYPKAIDQRRRMWDVNINVPLPEGTTFLAADAPPPFTASFDGQEISFFSLELAHQVEVGPLAFQVSTAGVTDPVVATDVWAAWKNAGSRVGLTIPAQEQFVTNEFVVQPRAPQTAVFDMIGDVPFSNYDLTRIALQESGSTLGVIFNTAGDVGPVGQPIRYSLFIDSDCNSETGQWREGRGGEYRVRYDHQSGRSTLSAWDVAQEEWLQVTRLNSSVDGETIMISVPRDLIGTDQPFCWVGQAVNRTEVFHPDPPSDWVPHEEYLSLAQYEFKTPFISSPSPLPAPAPVSPTATTTGIRGKLAVPLSNEQGFYDVHIFSLPDGQELAKISNARQPNFGADGQRLLINHESNDVEIFEHKADGRIVVHVLKYRGLLETISEYSLADGTEKQVSDTANDFHPFYDPSGRRAVYANSELTVGPDDAQPSYIFVQCSLLPPHQEVEPRCQDLLSSETPGPSEQPGTIWGNYPVWTRNNMIVYQGCDTRAETTVCGIYKIGARVTESFDEAAMPIQLSQDASDIPSDTKGDLIAFMSRREGNWEAYVMDLEGGDVRNLSNSPDSNDGLPTISPDGKWVAFVSDHNDRWAVWVVPVNGGPAQQLFKLPANTPWGDGHRTWTNERISWGP